MDRRFTDGEGCYSIAIVRNRVCRLGWQVQHEFSVTQSARSLEALELIREFFGCGTIIPNRRRDNHNDLMLRFSVKRRTDLVEVVAPFFTDHPLRTAKRADFSRFQLILDLMKEGRHLEERRTSGDRDDYRVDESTSAISIPGILRGHTPAFSHRFEMKIWSELRGDTKVTRAKFLVG